MHEEIDSEILPSSSGNPGTLVLIPIILNSSLNRNVPHHKDYENLNCYNVIILRRIMALKFREFWSVVLYPKDNCHSVADFLILTSFRELLQYNNNETEAILKLVYMLVKRIFGPKNYLQKEGWNLKLDNWISQTWAAASLQSQVISAQAFFNVIEVLYKYGKSHKKIIGILEETFSNPGISEIFSYPLDVFLKLCTYINTHFDKREVGDLINTSRESNRFNTRIKFTLPQKLPNTHQKEYVFSNDTLLLVCFGARDLAMALTLCPSLTRLVHENPIFLLSVISTLYKIASRNLFSDISFYKDPYLNRKEAENLFKEIKGTTDIPIEDLTFSNPNNLVELLSKLKYLLLSLAERWLWLRFGPYILDCLESTDKDNILPKFLDNWVKFSDRPSSYSISGLEAAEHLSQFSIALSNLEVIDKEVAIGTSPRKYVYLVNASLIADLNKRSNLLVRFKYACNFHCPLSDAYYITHTIKILTDVKNSTRYLNDNDEPAIIKKDETNKLLTQRIVKLMKVVDAPFVTIIFEALESNSADVLELVMYSTDKVNSLTDNQILEAAANIISSSKEEATLSTQLSSSPLHNDIRKKTLILDEKICQEEFAIEQAINEYNSLIEGSGNMKEKEPILIEYYRKNRDVYLKSSRNTTLRNKLKNITGFDDGIIESWYSYCHKRIGDSLQSENLVTNESLSVENHRHSPNNFSHLNQRFGSRGSRKYSRNNSRRGSGSNQGRTPQNRNKNIAK